MQVKNRFLTITLPLVLWTAVMIVVSSTPGNSLPEIGLWNFDKLAHTVEFFIFSILLFRYFFLGRRIMLSSVWKLCVIIGLVYAGLDELHQLLIPNRCCTWQDFVADGAGVVSAVAAGCRFYAQKAPA